MSSGIFASVPRLTWGRRGLYTRRQHGMRRLKAFFLRHQERTVVLLSLAGVLILAFLVEPKIAFLNFFFLPVILAGYFLGRRQAVLSATFCVLLYFAYVVLSRLTAKVPPPITTEQVVVTLTWGGFLIVIAATIGTLSEQRENRLREVRRAYVGILGVVLKYLEIVDEAAPRTVRVSLLAGKIARAAGCQTREVENVKSAALLAAAGDLRSSLSLFEDASQSMENVAFVAQSGLGPRERVMLRSTASLLKELGPMLGAYFQHFAGDPPAPTGPLPEDLPLGSGIIALADLYERMTDKGPQKVNGHSVASLADIQNLSGTYPAAAVQALLDSIPLPN